jgi:hypothetical protein
MGNHSVGHLLIHNYGPPLWTFGMGMHKHTISLHVEGRYFYKWPQLWSFVLVVQIGAPVPEVIIFAPEVNVWLQV